MKEQRVAPANAILFHFDWVLRSYDERIRKITAYAYQNSQAAKAMAHMSIYEMVPEEWHMFAGLTHMPFVGFARSIHHVCWTGS